MTTSFESRLADRYGDLTDALRQAASYVEQNPVDFVTRPLRKLSRDSGVSPAAFSRLSQALDYTDFEELREEMREKLHRKVGNFAGRAERLQQDHQDSVTGFLDAHLAAAHANLEALGDRMDRVLLDQAVIEISKARQVLLVGALGSTGVIEYLSYMANFYTQTWSLASRMGASLGAGLTSLQENDVLIIVTKPPFAAQSIKAAEFARKKGVYVVVITDTNTCPALRHSSAGFVLPTASPHFFSSYVSTVFFVEVLIGLIVSRAGDKARERIEEVEGTTRLLAEVWDQ